MTPDSPALANPQDRIPVHVVAQFSWGLTILFVLASACWLLLPYTGSMFSALVFLLAIVLAGTRWNRGPVLTMAAAAALVWNYLFIPPRFTFHIAHPEDAIMFAMFFVVAISMGHLITRIRAREAALEQHHREREELQEDKHRAELAAEAERLHRTLLDSVSHELKTPITLIRTALEGLDPLNPFTAEIDTAVRRLQRIVEHFIEITRVESDAVKPRPDWCEISDILHAATTPLARELSNHPLRLSETDPLPLLRLDSRLLAQALANVLHNATQHAPIHSPLEIQLTCFPLPSSPDPKTSGSPLKTTFPSKTTHTLQIRIRDHGPGLPTGMEDQIFEKFARAKGAPPGGTGLGLAISRGLLRAMKGDLRASNATGGGAEFLITLPVETRQP
jgi:K+-sensing histidine kinase KdpD